MTEAFEKLSRPSVAALNEILGHPLKVLDDGFVRVIDYMGDDASIVQAARVSYGVGTKQVREDRGLIRYLMRHWHSTPFEMCELKLHVRVPMDCWRQWIRHRTANVNEYSTRYSVAIDSAQCTAPGAWRLQAASNKQGSEGLLDADRGAAFSEGERALHEQARKVYQERLAAGIAREQARKDLPLSTYTEAYWKIDLGNLLHFLLLRMAPNAQLEIRSYAETIGNEIVSRWCPLAWEAFLDYRFNAMGFSEPELKLIRLLSAAKTEEARSLAEELGFLRKSGEGWKPGAEGRELEEKLERLGLKSPW